MDTDKLDQIINDLVHFKQELKKAKAVKTPLTTPPGIRFAVNCDGVVVGLYFNDDTQVLGYHKSGVYEVNMPIEYASSPKECLPLTPCEYVDLKPGDFHVATDEILPSTITEFGLLLPNDFIAWISDKAPAVCEVAPGEHFYRIGK